MSEKVTELTPMGELVATATEKGLGIQMQPGILTGFWIFVYVPGPERSRKRQRSFRGEREAVISQALEYVRDFTFES